jgi:acetyltransferase-like isoleucine patch superfamily enzyme
MRLVRYYFWRLFSWARPDSIRGRLAAFQPGNLVTASPMLLGKRVIFQVARGGEARVGKCFRTCRDVEILVYPGGRLDIGDHVYVGHASVIACSGHLSIGSDTLIADMVTIRDKDHGIAPGTLIRKSKGNVREISIGHNCWLGSKVTVTAGSAMGDNVVVGANSVVTKRFGNNLLLGGVPALVIRSIECGETRLAAQYVGSPGGGLT